MPAHELIPEAQDDLLEWIAEDPGIRVRLFIETKGPRYRAMAKEMVRMMVGDSRQEEDTIADEAFCEAMAVLVRRANAHPDDDRHIYNIRCLDAFIKGTLSKCIRSYLRRRRKADAVLNLEDCNPEEFCRGDREHHFIEEEANATLSKQVYDCMQKLKPSERQYLATRIQLLDAGEPGEASDIANVLDKSPIAVRTGLSTGRKAMRECLEKKGIPTAEGDAA